MTRYSAKTYAARNAKALEEHAKLDTERFNRIEAALASIAADVKSLLESRSYVRGAWRAIVTIAVAVSAAS